MNCKFMVGQKVISTKSDPWQPDPGPAKGKVCTILEITADHPWYNDIVGLVLVGYGNVRYNAKFFEPVHEKKTDISIFQEMLTKTPATIDA